MVIELSNSKLHYFGHLIQAHFPYLYCVVPHLAGDMMMMVVFVCMLTSDSLVLHPQRPPKKLVHMESLFFSLLK